MLTNTMPHGSIVDIRERDPNRSRLSECSLQVNQRRQVTLRWVWNQSQSWQLKQQYTGSLVGSTARLQFFIGRTRQIGNLGSWMSRAVKRVSSYVRSCVSQRHTLKITVVTPKIGLAQSLKWNPSSYSWLTSPADRRTYNGYIDELTVSISPNPWASSHSSRPGGTWRLYLSLPLSESV